MKHFTLVMTAFLTTHLLAQIPANSPQNGLYAYWPLDFGNYWEDISVNNYHLSEYPSWVPIELNDFQTGYNNVDGTALIFDPVENFFFDFEYSTPGSFVPEVGYVDFSISCWIKTTNPNATEMGIIGWGLENFFRLKLLVTADGRLEFNIGDQDFQQNMFSSASITDGTWHHVVVTRDINGFTTLYIDGQVSSTQQLFLPLWNPSIGAYSLGIIGGVISDDLFLLSPQDTYGLYNGVLDDIGVWNRVLTSEEITVMYEGCPVITAQPSNENQPLFTDAMFVTENSSPNANYQWQTDVGFGYQDLTEAGQYTGTNNDTLHVSFIGTNNYGQLFRCITAYGNCVDTSDVAQLIVVNNLGIEEIQNATDKKLLKITDLNGRETPFRKNTVLLFIYEDGTVERVFEEE